MATEYCLSIGRGRSLGFEIYPLAHWLNLGQATSYGTCFLSHKMGSLTLRGWFSPNELIRQEGPKLFIGRGNSF